MAQNERSATMHRIDHRGVLRYAAENVHAATKKLTCGRDHTLSAPLRFGQIVSPVHDQVNLSGVIRLREELDHAIGVEHRARLGIGHDDDFPSRPQEQLGRRGETRREIDQHQFAVIEMRLETVDEMPQFSAVETGQPTDARSPRKQPYATGARLHQPGSKLR